MRRTDKSNTVKRMRPVALALLLLIAAPPSLLAQVKTIVSGGFRAAYMAALPEFERTAGLTVTTGSGASQGNGPNTIGAQLARGVPADVVIMSKEGLEDLVKAGRLVSGSVVDLARTPVGVAVRADQLYGDADTITRLSYASLKDVFDTEFARDLLHLHSLALVHEGRVARDHEQVVEARQLRNDVLGEAVREKLLLGISAHVDERQHRDRRLLHDDGFCRAIRRDPR